MALHGTAGCRPGHLGATRPRPLLRDVACHTSPVAYVSNSPPGSINKRSLCQLFVDRRWQLPGWGYPLFLLPNSFKWTLTARRLSVWSVYRPGRRVDLADAPHHVGNTRFLVEKSDSEAVGGRNKFMTRLPRKRLSRRAYRSEGEVKSGPPEPIPVKPRNCKWELSMFWLNPSLTLFLPHTVTNSLKPHDFRR